MGLRALRHTRSNTSKLTAIMVSLGLSLGFSAPSLASEVFKAPEDLSQVRPQQLCVHYTEQSDAEKERFFNRLDELSQLSHKDYELISQGRVEPGSSMCGMYMTLGKPLHEDGIQIRPMVFKVVHIYPEHYIVTQSGMVMEVHDRIEGEMPPTLRHERPDVVPPPVLHTR